MLTFLDLVLPLECGGCARPGSRWCTECVAELAAAPKRIRPRVDVAAPCFALGPYSGPRRRAVIAAKERGRRDLADPLGAALALALRRLRAAGELDPPELAGLALVPAPTRTRAARVRGGDPVTCAATAAAERVPRCSVVPALRFRRGVRDSVGLSPADRRANLAGRVRFVPSPGLAGNVVVVDDVLTTGATAHEAVHTLAAAGITTSAVLVIAAA